MMAASDPRTAELAANLAAVRDRIAAAVAGANRPAGSVTLVAITKNWPAADVVRLASLGVEHVGENRDQEAEPKHAATAALGLTWHFVGQLQRNKAASVARYADVVESVDRPGLVLALARGALASQRELGVCLQVDLGNEADAGRAGVAPTEMLGLADLVAEQQNLRLLGLMAVAPLGVDPAGPFAELAELSERLRAQHPGADMVSAGMSADMAAAIAAGATHVRIGTALMGPRTAR